MNTIEAMHIFVRVAELASFTRAADTLGLPKATASTAVQQLEASVGARLLHRTTRKVELTQDGRAFYERCKDLLSDMDELQTMFQRAPQALSGRLRVAMSSGIARHFVLPRLAAWLQSHPRIELELSSTDRRVDLVREGFDCTVRVGNLTDSSLVARPLGAFAIGNYASRAYLEHYGVPRTIDDLADHRLIHFVGTLGGKSEGFEYPDGKGGYANLAMAGALTVNNADAYQAACIAGLGIIQAPCIGIDHLLASGALVEILTDLVSEPMPVTLLYPHRRNLSARTQAFMNWMADVLTPHLIEQR
jgi:DNA-binding transcriptional LysR family regulator